MKCLYIIYIFNILVWTSTSAAILKPLTSRVRMTSSLLRMSAESSIPLSALEKKTPDYLAAGSYIAATSFQWSLIVAFLHGFQRALTKVPSLLPSFINPDFTKSFLVANFFLFMSLKSRIFSPLDNSRPRYRSEHICSVLY